MGLLDILNTIQNTLPPGGGTPSDPRTRPAPGSAAGGQSMSPMAKALLALLAVYAMKNMRRSGSEPAKPGGTITAGNQGGGLGAPGGGGGLGDLLKGPLGGILGGTLGGAAAGTILNGAWATCSSSCRTAGKATSPSPGSAPGRTRRSRSTISQTPSGAIRLTS